MAEEPTNGELARQLADIKQLIGGVVGHPEYAADKRAVDFRLAELERDIAEERRERAEAMRAVNERITEQARAAGESRGRWHDRLWTGALPALVAAAGVIVTLWISHHGGH